MFLINFFESTPGRVFVIFLGIVAIVFGLQTHTFGGGVAAFIGLLALILGVLGEHAAPSHHAQ